MPKRISLIGKRFGRLKVIKDAPPIRSPGGFTKLRVVCKCDCGTLKTVLNDSLREGKTESCGCLQRQRVSETFKIHGYSGSPTYKTWASMIQRCTNSGNPDFHNYGGAGITVCARWRNFSNFVTDMGERPQGRSLDRWPDPFGIYEKKNCRWATQKEQSRNARTNRIVTVNGVRACIAEHCERLGLRHNTVKMRLHRGWSVERAFCHGL